MPPSFFPSSSWEYPNSLGVGCNEKSDSDAANFLSLLQAIRADPAGKNLYLTAAVSSTPFTGSDGNPMTDVSGFAAVLDHIAIMNYDVNVGAHVSRTGSHLIIQSVGSMDH